jgi:hypothetical protein
MVYSSAHWPRKIELRPSEDGMRRPPRFSRLVYDLSRPGELKSRMETSQDGQNWVLHLEVTYTPG